MSAYSAPMNAPTRTFAFTDAAIRRLALPPKPLQLDYFDTVQTGLGIRVSYGGTKSFFVMYVVGRKRQRFGLGEYGRLEDGRLPLAVARRRARTRLGEVADGKHPAADARVARRAPTVAMLVTEFVEMQRARGRKSAAKQERMLRRDVVPAIGDMKVLDVSRADIKQIIKTVTARGPVMANRIHEVMRAMFSYAIEEESFGIEANPADRLGRHRNPEHGRERWLSLEELGRYWRAMDDSAVADALRLCLLTGQRKANVLGIRADQVSLADRIWIIPASSTKTARTYKVPLSRMAAELIATSLEKGGFGFSVSTLDRYHRDVCARAGIVDYVLHDHRHTFATHAEQMGLPRIIWDAVLGHVGTTMADRYSNYDFADLRHSCMQRWTDRVTAAAAENVVEISSKIRSRSA
jgi:integrase